MVTQSASQAKGNGSPRKTEFCSKLSDLYFSLIGAALLEDVWKRLLTDEERVQWDSPKSAHANCGNAVNLYSKAKGISLYASIIELWRSYNLPDIDYNWLCRELFHFTGERVGPLAVKTDSLNIATVSDKPEWNPYRNELWFQGQCIRSVKGRTIAFNLHAILNAFQEEGWPEHIYDPLPNGTNSGRLRTTIATLNEGLSGIVFLADGTGEGIRWELRSDSSKAEDQSSESY